MLKKLLKYDLKNIYKFLIIFYSLAIFFSVLTRIFLNIEDSFIMNIIGQICSGVTISMMINILPELMRKNVFPAAIVLQNVLSAPYWSAHKCWMF